MPLRFTLRQLEYLVAVGESGSIALAAERVNVSSPSISAAISQLEAEFGINLFVRRHAHGLSLTPAGRQFVARAREVLGVCNSLGELAAEITSEVRGPLSVGCLLTFAQIVLPRVRRGFVDSWPEVRFVQHELDQQAIFEGLRAATLDVALSYDLSVPADMEFIPLVSLPPYALLAEDHPLAGRPSVSVEEIAAWPMVLLDLPMSAEYFLSFFAAAGVEPRVAERTRDMSVMRSLVANGFGYSIANIRSRSDYAPDGRQIRHVPLTGPVRATQMGLIVARGAGRSRSVRAFIEHCRVEITPANVPGVMRPEAPALAG